jgi:hypothetical protein
MPAMKAIRSDLVDPEFGASLVEMADPVLPSGAWAQSPSPPAASAEAISTSSCLALDSRPRSGART